MKYKEREINAIRKIGNHIAVNTIPNCNAWEIVLDEEVKNKLINELNIK